MADGGRVVPCVTGRWPDAAAVLGCARLAEAMQHALRPLLELRLDLLAGVDEAALGALVGHFGPQRVVVTCRGAMQGGVAARATDLDLAARRRLWLRAHALGVAFVDVDGDVWLADAPLRRALGAASPRGSRPRVVVSWHHWGRVPGYARLQRDYDAAVDVGADVVKLACAITSASEATPLMQLVAAVASEAAAVGEGPRVPLLPLALGPAGSWSRLILARQRPVPPLTYCTLEPGEGTAAGQPTLAELAARAPLQVTPAGPLYAVVGAPLVQSRSPALHVQVLRHYNLAGSYVALEERRAPRRLLRKLAPLLGLRGASITAPHKAMAQGVCAWRSVLARRAGAVNTLVWRGAGRDPRRPWDGSNTDGAALRAEVRRLCGGALAGRRCLVLGTGGTAAVALAALGAAGAKLGVWGRRREVTLALATRACAEAVAPDALEAALGRAEVLVHCTPVGMAPHEGECLLSVVALRRLPANAVVFDAIYAPAQTLLVRRARALHIPAAGGTGMFLRQAQGQCVALYGVRPPLQLLHTWLDGPQRPVTA